MMASVPVAAARLIPSPVMVALHDSQGGCRDMLGGWCMSGGDVCVCVCLCVSGVGHAHVCVNQLFMLYSYILGGINIIHIFLTMWASGAFNPSVAEGRSVAKLNRSQEEGNV